jgi:hypothetical protein
MIHVETELPQTEFIAKYCALRIDEMGIVQAVYDAGCSEDTSLAEANSEELEQLQPFRLLLDIRGLLTLNRTIHDYFSVDTPVTSFSAVAFVVASPIGNIIANLFISLYKPQLPVKIFRTYHEAYAWLGSY